MIVLKQENQLMTLTFDACSLHFERNSLISLPIGAEARTTPILRRIRLVYFPKMRISVQGRARASSMPSYAGGMLLFLSERMTALAPAFSKVIDGIGSPNTARAEKLYTP